MQVSHYSYELTDATDPCRIFLIGENTSSYMISLHLDFGFLSEKPKHKHLHITNHMFKGIF